MYLETKRDPRANAGMGEKENKTGQNQLGE